MIKISKQTTRSDCNKHIIKREHYTRKNGSWKPKKKFDTQEEADKWIKKYKMYKYTSYLCKVCKKWHIGMKKKMNNLSTYIIEKLRIDKDTKISHQRYSEDLYNVENIITDWLKGHTYFGCKWDDFEIYKKQEPTDGRLYVFLKYKNEQFNKWKEGFGKDIIDIIKEKLDKTWYWDLNDKMLVFSDEYIQL